MLQPKLDSFHGFAKVLASTTKSRFTEVDDIDETMGLTAIYITNAAVLQENFDIQNTLQKNLVELTTNSKGLSVTQLRRQKRKRRNTN